MILRLPVLPLVLLGLLVGTPEVPAATITVDTTAGDDVDDPGDGPCSFREALRNVFALAQPADDCEAADGNMDTIVFPGAPTITLDPMGTIADIPNDLVIQGPVTFDGDSQQVGSLLKIKSSAEVVVNLATFQSFGNSVITLESTANLTINASVFDDNTANNGAAINTSGSGILRINGGAFTRNEVSGNGGAILKGTGTELFVSASEFGGPLLGNSADRGGAIYITGTAAGESVVLSGVIFMANESTGTDSADGGGAIYVQGTDDASFFQIFGSSFGDPVGFDLSLGNTAMSRGGAIYNNSSDEGLLDQTAIGLVSLKGIVGCRFIGNSSDGTGADGLGGAIYNQGFLGIYHSMFANNSSNNSDGGAVGDNQMVSTPTMVIANTTFHANDAAGNGGALSLFNGNGDATLRAVTFSGNTASGMGREIFADGDVDLGNVLIANTSAGANCAGGGTFTDSNGNLEHEPGNSASCGLSAGPDPLLGSLTFNPGPIFVETMELGMGSPALGAGDPGHCGGPPVFSLDARGIPRPSACDTGAFEGGDVARLVINEVDYDQGATDDHEFIEIVNAGTDSIDLDNVTVEIVDGAGGGATVATTIDLPATTLAPGGFYVICGQTGNGVPATNCDLDTMPDTDLIEDGDPDAVGLRLSGLLVDTLSYGGDTGDPYTETTGAGDDTPTEPFFGLSRLPDGDDTDDNSTDFSGRCATPKLPNDTATTTCSQVGPPNPDLDVTPDAGLAFGLVETGMTSMVMNATVTNTGNLPLNGLSFTFGGDFQRNGGDCTTTLAVGAMCTVGVEFAPAADGVQNQMLTANTTEMASDAIPLTGEGFTAMPAIDVTPDVGLDFGMVETGTTSMVMNATVTNTGNVDLNGLAFVFGGEFQRNGGTCGMTLAVGAMCTVGVEFAPTADGAQMEMLTANTTETATDMIPLAGEGFTPSPGIDVTPDAGLDFGMVETGTTSMVMNATVTNTGNVDLNGLAFVFGGEFQRNGGTCGMTLGVGAMCTVGVEFAPTADGAQMEMLTANTTEMATDAIPLAGEGFTPSPGIDLTPDVGLDFGMVETGTTSMVMNATLENTGATDLTGIVFGFTGEFQRNGGDCGTMLGSGMTCTVGVEFAPTADGPQAGNLSVTADGGLMDAIPLAGEGFTVAPGIDVTPDLGLDFGMVQVGTTSMVVNATVTNTGTAQLTGIAVSFTGAFQRNGGSCGATLGMGMSCTIGVEFAPVASGVQNGMLTVDADGMLSDSIPLVGEGTPPPPGLDVTPDGGLAFGMIETGTTSPVMNATLTNTGGSSLTNVLVSFMGEFQRNGGTCGATLPVSMSCTIGVEFAPSADGPQNGLLTVDADGMLSDSIPLSGEGFTPTPGLDVTPDAGLDFGLVPTGTTSGVLDATVTNTGAAMITGLTTAFTGDFQRNGGSCGATLGVGASCTVGVEFSPLADGPQGGNLTVTADGGLLDAIPLTGEGVPMAAGFSSSPAPPGPVVLAGPASSMASASIVVSETGNANLVLSAPSLGGADPAQFTLVTTFPITVSDGGPPATIDLECTTPPAGAFTATLSFLTNDPGASMVTYDLECVVGGGQVIDIPTLGDLGLVLLMTLLALGGVVVLRREG